MGFPGGSNWEESVCNAGELGLILGSELWVGRLPWREKWQPTPVFLPGEFHGQRNLEGYILSIGLQSWTWLNNLEIIIFFSFHFFFISWRLITLQYCSGFCHTLTWISHGVTCIPHPDPLSHLPLHQIPLGLPSAPGPSTCLMHPTRDYY